MKVRKWCKGKMRLTLMHKRPEILDSEERRHNDMKVSEWCKGKMRLTLLWTLGVVTAVAISACIQPIAAPTGGTVVLARSKLTGEELFSLPFPEAKNQRACATCHVPADNFTLTPAHVARLLAETPNDPLFSAIDADDPNAEMLTFEHLKKGLVRVWLTLPGSMDLIDDVGNVITPADRKIFVWRGVPSIADAALTAPYQLDGREATLESQAQGAISSHSEGVAAPASELTRIAEFERATFTSDRVRDVASLLASGADPGQIPDVEGELDLTPQEARGREVFNAACAACHGGATMTTIVDREIHDLAFPALWPDGTVMYKAPATEPPTLVLATQPDNEFINIGSAVENFMVQIGATEHKSFTEGLSYPQYRFRFYKDATRTEVIAELPPALPPARGVRSDCGFGADGGNGGGPGDSGGPGDGGGSGDGGSFIDPALFAPSFDADCNPVTGPNFFPQMFTTDPGRAAITGNPYDFEAFDIPTLRGISKTAPYWHNNISATIADVVELYSDHLLIKFPPLILEGEKEADADGDIGATNEALTRQQKDDLIAFLKRQ